MIAPLPQRSGEVTLRGETSSVIVRPVREESNPSARPCNLLRASRVNRASAIDGQTDAGYEIIFDQRYNSTGDVVRTALALNERGGDRLTPLLRGQIGRQHDRPRQNAVNTHARIA